MAVAVKTSPGARSTGPGASAAILSVVGVFYLLACLVIVFSVLPGLWWPAWTALGFGSYTFVGGTLLGLLCLSVGVALLVAGARLLGPNPPVGVRSGVFVGFLGLLLALLLTRWASLWAEYWAYEGAISPTAGRLGTAAFAAVMLLLWLLMFWRPGVQKFIVALEAAGWFHATSYKSNQGQKVRRGTIVGILLIVGAGIYTLISHNTLGRGAPDWKINVPFTGTVAVESFGDVRGLLADANVPKNEVEVRWPGVDTGLSKGPPAISFDLYRSKVMAAVAGHPEAAAALAEAKEPTAFLMAVNEKVLGKRMQELLRQRVFPEGETRRLELRFNNTPWESVGDLAGEFYRAAQQLNSHNPLKVLGDEFAVPSAVLVIDRYALRDINAEAADKVKVLLKGDSDFTEGQIVSASDFEKEVSRLEEMRKKGRDRVLPTRAAVAPATGKVEYMGITLLPSVQFTVPLLLLVGSLWLAWRAVNMPTFADFLIATEAELNKVSWTTQRKLVQDTIVVLVTVLLMAIFLFGMDLMWKKLLSDDWRFGVGVLHLPPAEARQTKTFENKKY